MTAICGGGSSGPKAGASAVVLVGSGVIATILEKSGNAWLAFAAALLTLPELVLSTFCGSDPPSVPTFTSAESKALLNLSFGADFDSGLVKFTALVQNLAWQEYCQCTSGALVVPAPVTPPSGTPIYQPPSPQVASPCGTNTESSSVNNTGQINWPLFFPAAGFNPTAVVGTITSSINSGPGANWTVDAIVTDGTTNFTFHSGLLLAPGASPTVTIPVNVPNAHYAYLQVNGQPGLTGGRTNISGTADWYCNGALPGLVPQSCCPPDVATQSTLDLILRMVTLIQRQHVPFATVHGVAHTGLSGNGQFAVSGLLGVKVELTTTPGRLGVTSGDPETIWGAGWVAVGTADGFNPRQFISTSPMILEPISPDTTIVGYSIPSDVTITITELVRES